MGDRVERSILDATIDAFLRREVEGGGAPSTEARTIADALLHAKVVTAEQHETLLLELARGEQRAFEQAHEQMRKRFAEAQERSWRRRLRRWWRELPAG